jgi:hypothetical protein
MGPGTSHIAGRNQGKELITMSERPASYKRLWGLFAFVVLASFAVLGGFGFRIASEAPPIPDKVVVEGTGKLLFDGDTIRKGQNACRPRSPRETTRMRPEQRRAIFWGVFAAGLLGVAIFVGSRNLWHIDAALVGYTFACLFAAFGLGYRYSMWLQRPPTRMYWRRGWQSFLRRGHLWRSLKGFVTRFVSVFLLNLFIWRRSRSRGLTHMLIMWGCLLAAAIT